MVRSPKSLTVTLAG
jgi:hypothetical protein